MREVDCVKLKTRGEGLAKAPYPGELGQRIFDHISKDAWQQWIQQQTILLNEYRLTPINPKDRKFLEEQMEKFLFGDGVDLPDAYKPTEN